MIPETDELKHLCSGSEQSDEYDQRSGTGAADALAERQRWRRHSEVSSE